ncbi:MAG: S9 family peptidase [Actinomycetota bacterium]
MAATTDHDRPPTDRPARRPIEPADLCRLRQVVDVAIHPDGGHVVAVIGWPDAESDTNRAVLEACDVDGSGRRRLSDGHADRQPRFSPDGRRLVFLRGRPKEPARVAIADWPSGEITEVATLPDGVIDVQWAGPDRLVLLAGSRTPADEGVDAGELARRPRILSRLNYRFNGRGWTDKPRQVLVLDRPGSGSTPRPIGSSGVDHGAIAVAPDGRHIAAVAAVGPDHDVTGRNDVWLLDAGSLPEPDRDADADADTDTDADADAGAGADTDAPTGTGESAPEPVRLTAPGDKWFGLAWHPDGTLVGFGMIDRPKMGYSRVHVIHVPDGLLTGDHVDNAPGPPPPLTQADQNLVMGAAVRSIVPVDGGFLFPGLRRGRVAIDRHGLGGDHTAVHEDAHQVTAFDATADGSIIVGAVTSPTTPAELWRLDGEPRRLLGLNDDLLAALDLAEVEEVTTTAADGTEVHAFLARPPASAPAADPAGRPGLLYVHGGPLGQYGLSFFDEFQMAAACGYVVIGGNPRGSDGYGEAWARSIEGDLGNLDWIDVTALADHLATDDEVDADRLGIGGGSYGGFMTGWALARDRRFKAGLVERAVTSWTTMFGTSDIGPWFTEATIGASIEGDHEEVRRQSPLTYAADIEVPTLILHSEEDWRCPIEQAEQLFAAIRRNGGDAILVRFPGENHELSRSGIPSHRIERLQIVHEFYARHLGGADFGTSHLEGHGRPS